MIPERRLKKWRKEALVLKELHARHNNIDGMSAQLTIEFCTRILSLAQELLDQHLIQKERGND